MTELPCIVCKTYHSEREGCMNEARKALRSGGVPPNMFDPNSQQWLRKDGKWTKFGEQYFAEYMERASDQANPKKTQKIKGKKEAVKCQKKQPVRKPSPKR